jgi:hypothetical protein
MGKIGRRGFLSMLAGAAAAPLLLNRVIFLPPVGGWPRIPSAQMIIPRRAVEEFYGEALASGDYAYDIHTEMMSIFNRPPFVPDPGDLMYPSERDLKIINAGGKWIDSKYITEEMPQRVYIAKSVGTVRGPAFVDRSPYQPGLDEARTAEIMKPLYADSEFAKASEESRIAASARAAAIKAKQARREAASMEWKARNGCYWDKGFDSVKYKQYRAYMDSVG